eukprot:1239047-Amphidinium_carterae.1
MEWQGKCDNMQDVQAQGTSILKKNRLHVPCYASISASCGRHSRVAVLRAWENFKKQSTFRGFCRNRS